MKPTQEFPYGNGEDGKLSVTSSFNWRSKAAKTYEMKDKSLKSLGGDKYRVEATNANVRDAMRPGGEHPHPASSLRQHAQ